MFQSCKLKTTFIYLCFYANHCLLLCYTINYFENWLTVKSKIHQMSLITFNISKNWEKGIILGQQRSDLWNQRQTLTAEHAQVIQFGMKKEHANREFLWITRHSNITKWSNCSKGFVLAQDSHSLIYRFIFHGNLTSERFCFWSKQWHKGIVSNLINKIVEGRK